MKNILFYKFIELQDLAQLRDEIRKISANLLGKVLIAHEGLNGCVSGSAREIEGFKHSMEELFGNIDFKDTSASNHTFKKMQVKIRKEIITFKQEIDLDNSAPYIEPQELKELLDAGEDVVLLDARNIYESKIGKFEGAIAPNIILFSQLPKVLEKMPELKDKHIVTYCTGGIRCEKSSAWMRENGFTNVQQLHGGIIRYGLECGDAHWQGKCFVFDRRGAIDINPQNETEPISQCELCFIPCGEYHNCAYIPCDKHFICCKKCLEIFEGCCSKKCRSEIQIHPEQKAETFLEVERPVQH